MKFNLCGDDAEVFLQALTTTSLSQIILYADGTPIKHHLTKAAILDGLDVEVWKQTIEVSEEAHYAIQTFAMNDSRYIEAVALTRKSKQRKQRYQEGDFRIRSAIPMLIIAAVGYTRATNLKDAILFAFGIRDIRPAKAIASTAERQRRTENIVADAANLSKIADESIQILETHEFVDGEIEKVNKSMHSKKKSTSEKSGAAASEDNSDVDVRDASPVRSTKKKKSTAKSKRQRPDPMSQNTSKKRAPKKHTTRTVRGKSPKRIEVTD